MIVYKSISWSIDLKCNLHFFDVCRIDRFRSKEDAAAAIFSTHLRKINGHTVRCSWSKRSIASDIPVFSTAESKLDTCSPDHSSTANQLAISSHQPTNTSSTAISTPFMGSHTFLCGCQQCQAVTTWSSYCSGCSICPGFACQSPFVMQPPAVPVLAASSGYVYENILRYRIRIDDRI